MITAQRAMDQACMTSETYVRRAYYLYVEMFGQPKKSEMSTLMQFTDIYVRAATQDFDTWAKTHLVPSVTSIVGETDADV